MRILIGFIALRIQGIKKISPEFYPYILRDLGADPSQVLMVGDNFDYDVLAPNRVGIHGVWLNQSSGENKTGDLYSTIHSLRELIPLLMAGAGPRGGV